MDWLWQDARFALRTLRKDRGFLATAVLALALGIGSTTAIFSVIDNVLLEPFPYTDGQRLVGIEIHDSSSNRPFGRQFFSQPAKRGFVRTRQSSFSPIAGGSSAAARSVLEQLFDFGQ